MDLEVGHLVDPEVGHSVDWEGDHPVGPGEGYSEVQVVGSYHLGHQEVAPGGVGRSDRHEILG